MKKLIPCFILLLFACNNNEQKDFEILKLKKMVENSKLDSADSLRIYNHLKEDETYKEVLIMLDSLKIYDNKKYKILLDAAFFRGLEESE